MKKLFKNLNLIDGTGRAAQENMSLLVENGVIVEVGSNIDLSNHDACEELDLNGKYVMPGLIDCHTHIVSPATADPVTTCMKYTPVDYAITAIKKLQDLLEHGVTFIRDVGDAQHVTLGLKKYLADGSIKGPDMYSAGLAVMMTGGHGYYLGREADGVDEVRKAVREQLRAGADVIKVIASGGVMTPGVDVNAYQFNVDELSVAVEEAHKAGKKVCTHAHATQAIKNSIIAGIDSIEHSTILDDEAIDMLVKNGTYIVPTFAAVHYIVEGAEKAGIPKFAVDKAKEVSVHHMTGAKKAYDKGVKIAMGTDCGTPLNVHGISSQVELELMVQAGISPMDTIVAATKTAAELIGVERLHGTLEVGKYANFIVLTENPVENIKTVQSLENVFQKGNKVK